MPADLTLWHNRRDTLLRIADPRRPSDAYDDEAPYYSVYIPIGIYPGTRRRHNITLEYDIDLPYPADAGPEARAYWEWRHGESPYMRIGLDQCNRLGSLRRLTPDYLAHLRYLDPV